MVGIMIRKLAQPATWTGPAAFAIAVLWLLWLLITSLWPVTWWLDVRDVRVHDTTEGETILMSVDRVIVRDFSAQYFVQVRVIDSTGASGPVYCDGSSGGPYYSGTDLPIPVTLTWWAAGKCTELPPGKYRAITTWEIKPDVPVLPVKNLTVYSNVFEVRARES